MSSSGQQPIDPSAPPSRIKKLILNKDALCVGIAALAVGLTCLLLGNIMVNHIAIGERIVGYKEVDIGGGYISIWISVPVYETYTYHPFWIPGLIVLVVGIIVFILGILELILYAYQYNNGSRRSPARVSPEPKLEKKGKKNDLLYGSIAAIAIGIVCLVVASVLLNTEVTGERLVGTRFDYRTGMYKDIYETYTHYPFQDASAFLKIVGIIVFIAGIVALNLYAYLRIRSSGHQPPQKPSSES